MDRVKLKHYFIGNSDFRMEKKSDQNGKYDMKIHFKNFIKCLIY